MTATPHIRKCAAILTGCLALLLLTASTPSSADPFTITKDGQARCAIVLPNPPENDETLAAQELCHFVERISGARLRIVGPEDPGPKVYLGRAARFYWLPTSLGDRTLDHEEYLLEAAGDDLCLLGGSAQAALWAVYDVLEILGCGWYMPGVLGEVVPRRATLEIEGAPRIEGPDFPYRYLWYTWGGPADGAPRLAEWCRRNRLAHTQVLAGHNLTRSMPPSASFDKRPDLYALVDGVRRPTQVCTSNPEVIALITQTVNAFFDAHPEVQCYSLCPEDNRHFCECDACRALDAGGLDPDWLSPMVTDRYIAFLNQVAEGIQERHPGKMVSMYAYVNHTRPPIQTPVSPHVVIFFTSSSYCTGHGIGDPQCASRMRMKQHLEAWAKMCPNIYIREYDPAPGCADLPFPLYGARTREMPLYRAMGAKGLSMEMHCSWATLTPNHWFTARCLWDADQTLDSLLTQFCGGFFGLDDPDLSSKTARAMKAYYLTLEKAMAGFEPPIGWSTRRLPDFFLPEVVTACRGSLNEAIETAAEASGPRATLVQARLHMVDLGFRYLEEFLAGMKSLREGEDPALACRAYDRCIALADEMIAANPDYMEPHACYKNLHDAFERALDAPNTEGLGLITQWSILGPFDNQMNEGHARAYPPEQGPIDLSASYQGISGPVTWRQIAKPNAMGFVNLLSQFEQKDYATAYAYGVIHADREMEAQLRIGSNDGAKVWLDGKLLLDCPDERGATIDDDVIPFHLKAGATPILLKISQTGGNWGFYFRITDAQGRPAEKVTLNPTE